MSNTPYPYIKAIKPSGNRRAKFHNYAAPGEYLITLSKPKDCPDYCHLEGDPGNLLDPPRVCLHPSGRIIAGELDKYPKSRPYFSFRTSVIMPDHVHIHWIVNDYLPHDLGIYVGQFKSYCSKEYNLSLCDQPHARMNTVNKPSHRSVDTLFAENFNDRISFSQEISLRFSRYINDNPRRRLLVMSRPDLFDRVRSIQIAGYTMDFYGNFQLLRNPIIVPAIVSSRYTENEKTHYRKLWNEAMRTRGVLISPFISPKEKELMRSHIEAGGSIIRIIPDGMTARYKPSGMEIDLCAEGRLLHIGPSKQVISQLTLHRDFCLSLNDFARWIANNSDEAMTIIKGNMR